MWMDWLVIGPPDTCWEWTGSLGTTGYPQAKVGGRAGKVVRPHRLVAAMFGEVTGPVHHVCRNPLCLNPEHLLPTDSIAEHLLIHAREQSGPWKKKI
jgi:hypothetical protein